jgi:hypothetical protein
MGIIVRVQLKKMIMSSVCVVHLVWDKLGFEPFKRFIESYGKNAGGWPHDLLIIFQGHFKENGLAGYYDLLKPYSYHCMFRPNQGFDLSAYREAARKFNFDYFCFLNSYSVLLDENWLAKMHRYFTENDVGMVGATGSWESPYSISLLCPDDKQRPLHKRLLYKYWWKLWQYIYRFQFDPFPNYHIRTNAFMISRSLFNKIKGTCFYNKASTVRFECGRNSLSKQIMRIGLRLLVVGKDGVAHEKEDWARSNTFRQGAQDNLLVADNRTAQYINSDSDQRKRLSRITWGYL